MLQEALEDSLARTLPIFLRDQIPAENATHLYVEAWTKLWFSERGWLSPPAGTANSISRMRWDGLYLWQQSIRQLRRDREAVGLSNAACRALENDIVTARNQISFHLPLVLLVVSFLTYIV